MKSSPSCEERERENRNFHFQLFSAFSVELWADIEEEETRKRERVSYWENYLLKIIIYTACNMVEASSLGRPHNVLRSIIGFILKYEMVFKFDGFSLFGILKVDWSERELYDILKVGLE